MWPPIWASYIKLPCNKCSVHPGCQARTVEKEHCPDGKIRGENDIVCHTCPLGKIPNPAKNGCLACPKGTVSDGFYCSPCSMEYLDKQYLAYEILRSLTLKIIGTQGVSRSQQITSIELLRVADDQKSFIDMKEQDALKSLLLATGVQPGCSVLIKCPVGTKIKDLTCQPCRDGWQSDPLEESKCSNVDQPYTDTGQFYYWVLLGVLIDNLKGT